MKAKIEKALVVAKDPNAVFHPLVIDIGIGLSLNVPSPALISGAMMLHERIALAVLETNKALQDSERVDDYRGVHRAKEKIEKRFQRIITFLCK